MQAASESAHRPTESPAQSSFVLHGTESVSLGRFEVVVVCASVSPPLPEFVVVEPEPWVAVPLP